MTTSSVAQNSFPLREAVQLLSKLSEFIKQRSFVEIIFHPGVDPDAEAAVRLMRRLCLFLGADEPHIYNLGGSPSVLKSMDPELQVEGLKSSALIDPERRDDSVCIVVDVSNMKFAAGKYHRRGCKPDFLFDHHDKRTVSVQNGTLILPEMGCASLIIDRLLTIFLGHSSFYYEEPKLSSLVTAAVLTDLDLSLGDGKPEHIGSTVWNRVGQLQRLSDQSLLEEIVDGPWRTPEYCTAQDAILRELSLIKFGDITIAFAYMGILSEPDNRAWLAHLASLLIKDGPNRIIGEDQELPKAAFVLAGVRSPFSLACSLRTDGSINASDLINLVEPHSGGGRERAAGAIIHPRSWAPRIWSVDRRLATWSTRRIEAWIRKIESASSIFQTTKEQDLNVAPGAAHRSNE